VLDKVEGRLQGKEREGRLQGNQREVRGEVKGKRGERGERGERREGRGDFGRGVDVDVRWACTGRFGESRGISGEELGR
jgi:hypothetical protein